MSWTREFHLFLNIDLEPGMVLLSDKTGQAPAQRQDLVAADCFPCNIWLRKRSGVTGEAATAEVLEDTDQMILSAKVAGTNTLLFSATDFVLTGAGDERRYRAVLDLNTAPVLALFSGTAQSAIVVGEIEIQNAANTQRISAQFDLVIRRQIYAGEGPPISGTPVYPLPGAIVTFAGGAGFKFADGYLQLRDTSTGAWRGLFLNDGELAFTAETPADADEGDFWRFSGSHLQLRDASTGKWRSIFLNAGEVALGEEEDV